MDEITLDAVVANIETVTDFIDKILEDIECPMKVKIQIDIAIDEIFSNIVYYAYRDAAACKGADCNENTDSKEKSGNNENARRNDNKNGKVTVQIQTCDNPKSVSITFIDSGIPYNPLETKEPDITLSAEERQIGGLGIYMVKKNMDEMKYEYMDGKNCLTIMKFISQA